MSGYGFARRAAALAALALLAACGDAQGPGGGEAPAKSTEIVSRDVEAPNIFQVTEAGLWDGRPSLGGVWVAYPGVDVEQIGQVVIRNTANGRFVIGALFRREREAPGPALQVSSEAAEALGLLAGAPAELNVTALRRAEQPAPEAPGATTDFDDPQPIEAVPLEPAAAAGAIETAALPAAEASTTGAVTEVPARPEPAAASALERAFIQIGIFSVEANARDTATAMEVEGLTARVLSSQIQDKPYWRVVVGPAATEAARADALARVKALGFTDAYFVRD
ncbi:SPOR domain-containing protein [Limimaricola pyoseonensis]|uniref:Sporulation related domain-containing protein n=1 Tax=Limimaricola pyoseonensis TaxID=521013 RepID=A0A1G7D9P2_9RHOB|nr:SPOR domain-containing protein [Limimaricola pyoseonensis]SDE47465.1 Sporulation related domain-containing protein [Limimaricola pyoseonensis]